MNELDLIREVKKRPLLYDKTVSGFNRTKRRDEAWKAVQDALNASGSTYSTEVECKKRWRSLRDSYIKLQRTRGGKTRWPYVAAMKFLKPHVISENKDEETDGEEEARASVLCLPDLSYVETKHGNGHTGQSTGQQRPVVQHNDITSPEPSPKRARPSSRSSDDDNNSCLCNRNDPDELFLLSCAPSLKRLNARQNAAARLKIQQMLYECEFGDDDGQVSQITQITQVSHVSQVELPFVTPVSECSFESALNDASGDSNLQ